MGNQEADGAFRYNEVAPDSARPPGDYAGRVLFIICLLVVQAFVIGVVCLFNAVTVSAQTGDTTLSLKRALINIWPEYDDLRLLILYEGEFAANEADFPQVVRFPVPSGPLQVNQAAGLTQDAQYLRQPWEIINQPDGTGLLSYTLPIPTFFFEYYYPGIEGQESQAERRLYLSFAVSGGDVGVCHPGSATQPRLSPFACDDDSDQRSRRFHLSSSHLSQCATGPGDRD